MKTGLKFIYFIDLISNSDFVIFLKTFSFRIPSKFRLYHILNTFLFRGLSRILILFSI